MNRWESTLLKWGERETRQAGMRKQDKRWATSLKMLAAAAHFVAHSAARWARVAHFAVASVLAQHLSQEPTPLGELAQGLPPELEALVMGMLAKEPERRPTDLDAVARSLSTCLA